MLDGDEKKKYFDFPFRTGDFRPSTSIAFNMLMMKRINGETWRLIGKSTFITKADTAIWTFAPVYNRFCFFFFSKDTETRTSRVQNGRRLQNCAWSRAGGNTAAVGDNARRDKTFERPVRACVL